MKNLAGLHKIQYVFLYPDSRDIVIAGPAGAWAADQEGRQRHVASGEPVLQLDDFVVVLRNARQRGRTVHLLDHAAPREPGRDAGLPERIGQDAAASPDSATAGWPRSAA